MTATEELRRLLEECGVEWDTFSVSNTEYIHWTNNDGHWCAASIGGPLSLHVNILNATPAQAIAATLGRGECQDLGGTDENDEQIFNCSECGCMLSLYDRDGINNLCTSFVYDYPRYCPECGRKVVDNV